VKLYFNARPITMVIGENLDFKIVQFKFSPRINVTLHYGVDPFDYPNKLGISLNHTGDPTYKGPH
jgi:hypothetical protein